MLERLQKIIAAAGITSRRAAEELIAEGRVRVNGQVVTEPGSKADPAKDHIKVDGKLINPHQPPTYIMLNKPAGYMTTLSDPEGRPTVQDLLKGVKTRVYPVGRLDYNTEGLLLLTNDGDFAHLITHPKHEFPKTYRAKVKGVLEEQQIEKLEAGVYLDDGKTAPARVRKVSKEEMNSWLEITIHEGRKRQVRRMFDHVGHSVIKLKRIRTGSLALGDLPEGSFRHLTSEEVKALRETALKVDESGRQVRVFKPEVRTEKPWEARAHPVEIIDEDARKRSRARIEMRDTRTGIRKNQGKKTVPEVRPGGAGSGQRFVRSVASGEGSARSAPRRPSLGRPGEKPSYGSREGFVRRDSGGAGPARSALRRTGQKPALGSTSAGRRTEGSGWKPSGARPNKSRFTGGKGPGRKSGPGRGPGGGSRRPGR